MTDYRGGWQNPCINVLSVLVSGGVVLYTGFIGATVGASGFWLLFQQWG